MKKTTVKLNNIIAKTDALVLDKDQITHLKGGNQMGVIIGLEDIT